ncbi:MAG: ADP compounds hydrolase NudE [Pseudomonadota bacterium]
MKQKPIVKQKKIVARSRYFAIEQLDLEFSNGATRQFERIAGRSHGAVIIVPLQADDTLLLVSEYAAGLDRYELAFPKGMVNAGEDLVAATDRELKEEIGFGAKNIEAIKQTSAIPGYWGNHATIMLARDLYPEKLIGDEPEPLEVVPWKIQDYKQLLKREDFTEARSIAALLLVKALFY